MCVCDQIGQMNDELRTAESRFIPGCHVGRITTLRFVCVDLCVLLGVGDCMCELSIFFQHLILFTFSPLSMPLNRVIVPTVRQAAVCACVCVCALLFQGADSREVCLNREGAQRPCSSCGVWSQMIGPLFFLLFPSVRLSCLFFDSFSPTCLLLIAFFPPPPLYSALFSFLFFVCFSVCVACRLLAALADGLSPCCQSGPWLGHQYARYSASKLPEDEARTEISTFGRGGGGFFCDSPVYMFLFLMLSFPHGCTFPCIHPSVSVQLHKGFFSGLWSGVPFSLLSPPFGF